MITSQLPDYPWQKVGSDLFELGGSTFLLVVDYFSRFVEISKLTTTCSSSIITILKSIFARYGIPEIMISNNGPQYVSWEMKQFAKQYGFNHITSSPHYPQSNGQAKRAIQTVKKLLKQAADPWMALLNYRAAPLPWCSLSPAELLMGRRLWTTVPVTGTQLVPKWDCLPSFSKSERAFKRKQVSNYYSRHRTCLQSMLEDEEDVWVTTGEEKVKEQVRSLANTPRSYIPSGQVRRKNCSHLKTIPRELEKEDQDDGGITGKIQDDDGSTGETSENSSQPKTIKTENEPKAIGSPIMTRTRTRTSIKPPKRY